MSKSWKISDVKNKNHFCVMEVNKSISIIIPKAQQNDFRRTICFNTIFINRKQNHPFLSCVSCRDPPLHLLLNEFEFCEQHFEFTNLHQTLWTNLKFEFYQIKKFCTKQSVLQFSETCLSKASFHNFQAPLHPNLLTKFHNFIFWKLKFHNQPNISKQN